MEQLARRVVGGLNELICIRCFECCQEYQCVVIITTTIARLRSRKPQGKNGQRQTVLRKPAELGKRILAMTKP